MSTNRCDDSVSSAHATPAGAPLRGSQPVTPGTPPKRQRFYRRPGFATFLLSLVAYGAVFVLETVALIPIFLFDIPESSLMFSIIFEYTGIVAAVGAFVLLGGATWLAPSGNDLRFTFRFGWWAMALSVFFMVWDLAAYALEGFAVEPGVLKRFVELAVLCLGIGIMEECLFRGIVFNGLLALMGDTHRGVVWSVMVCSLVFGLAHVDTSVDFATPLMALQAVLKIVQTGMYSILLCVIVLRTRRLGGVSLFHGLDDFLVMVPGIVLYGESADTEYVTAGDDALPTIAFYLIVIALYLPFVIKSLRELRRGNDVYRGVFAERRQSAAPAPVGSASARVPVGLGPTNTPVEAKPAGASLTPVPPVARSYATGQSGVPRGIERIVQPAQPQEPDGPTQAPRDVRAPQYVWHAPTPPDPSPAAGSTQKLTNRSSWDNPSAYPYRGTDDRRRRPQPPHTR